jgi:hypothetical protein
MPHSAPTCAPGEFRRAGTHARDAACQPCSGCAGRRRLAACNATADDACADCGALRERQRWVSEGPAGDTECVLACEEGFELNTRSRECEPCTAKCAPGLLPPRARDNCTHCEACHPKPANSDWLTQDDRFDCAWECQPMHALVGDACVRWDTHTQRRVCLLLQYLLQSRDSTPVVINTHTDTHDRVTCDTFRKSSAAARCRSQQALIAGSHTVHCSLQNACSSVRGSRTPASVGHARVRAPSPSLTPSLRPVPGGAPTTRTPPRVIRAPVLILAFEPFMRSRRRAYGASTAAELQTPPSSLLRRLLCSMPFPSARTAFVPRPCMLPPSGQAYAARERSILQQSKAARQEPACAAARH